MYTRWTQNLKTDDEKEKFKQKVYQAKEVLDRLKEMIEEDELSMDRSEIHPKVYEVPNWDYLQAHKNGTRQYMYQMKTLINLDQQEGNTKS